MNTKFVKLFLRLSIATAFLSAVADRFGLWPENISVWGNWSNFLDYTQAINPWLPKGTISIAGIIATVLEILFALCLIIGFKTELFAKLSGLLLLLFGIAMTFSTGIKGAFDYSIFTAAAAAFALSALQEKYWELDSLIFKDTKK
ncbi:DoxX family protein [Mangrovimonas sp. DI 80]|uniref:DoxX family protein n=1 Tax=Mangrovimonas sp. DI 80 TaxID=1779330 RepID=UPI0009784692|nr:DoxX family protein [Mangrovimonas sp. DI 80]OMP32345.1 DoxX family protein [Mangrovimonas sp. DI 80]